MVVAWHDWGAGNDPEALGLALHQGSTFINAYCQAATNQIDRDWRQYGGSELPRPRRSLRFPRTLSSWPFIHNFLLSRKSTHSEVEVMWLI